MGEFLRIILCLIFFIFSTTLLCAQQTMVYKFAQFKVDSLVELEASRSIDQYIRSQKGVLTSRTDLNSGILFCVFEEQHINQSSFVQWLGAMGYGISCYREGMKGTETILSIKEMEELCE